MHEILYPVVRFISDHTLLLTALAAVAVMVITAVIPTANYLEPRWRPADPLYLGWAVAVVRGDTQQYFQAAPYNRYEWPHGRESVEAPTPTIYDSVHALRCVFGQDAHLVMGVVYPARVQKDGHHIRINSPIINGGTAVLGSEPMPIEIPWEDAEFLHVPIFVNWDEAETWRRSHTWNFTKTFPIGGASMKYPQQRVAEPFVLSENPLVPRCPPDG